MIKLRDMFATIQFWYARNFIKIEKHYTFFLDLNGPPGSFAVKLLDKYEGVIVEFTDIKIGYNNELSFKYQIISNLNNVNTESKSFARFTSHVMRNMIYGSIQNHLKEENENRNTDLVESDSERTVHEEVTPVPEKRVPDRKPRKKNIRANKGVHPKVQQFAPSRRIRNKSKRGNKSNRS